jgi:hypothetical protein
MIETLEGVIGSGKTYLAVSRIAAHLAHGGTVCTNIDIVVEGLSTAIREMFGIEWNGEGLVLFDEDATSQFWKICPQGSLECNVLCAVDEAQMWWGSRETRAFPKQLELWLQQSRKLHIDCLFMCQSGDDLDVKIRRQVRWSWRMMDLQSLRIPILGLSLPWPMTMAFQVDARRNVVYQRVFIKRSVLLYNSYKTDAILRPVEFAGEIKGRREVKKKAPVNLWVFSWKERLAMAFLLFCCVMLFRVTLLL